MTARAFAFGLCLLFPPAPAAAQTIVTSTGPDRVAVTVYRDTRRAPQEPFNLQWLNGFALISETRRVALPAGETELRFEGVASGIVPQSAIVTGLPDGAVERNQDAYLLSPATLLDRSLERRVMLRRTELATGAVREQDAVIRSGAGGAVVLQTDAGFESLRCTGLSETPLYGQVPAGLSARPTFSVRARSRQAVTATVTLSYLASGFDWRANYIAELAPDGRHVDLFAWLTLASNDDTSFVHADAQAVAGRVNREDAEVQPSEGGALTLRCWPQASTSDIPLEEWRLMPMPRSMFDRTIVVTGQQQSSAMLTSVSPVTAVYGEDLGDLKLYRIPEPVTVAANSQKQVALLVRPRVAVEIVWWTFMSDSPDQEPETKLQLRTVNRTDRGLGLPLPAGGIALFQDYGGRPFLVGEGTLYDRAVGEQVGIEFPAPPGLHVARAPVMRDGRQVALRVVVTNSMPQPIRHVALFPDYLGGDDRLDDRFDRRLVRDGDYWVWETEVPANGSVAIEWEQRRVRPR